MKRWTTSLVYHMDLIISRIREGNESERAKPTRYLVLRKRYGKNKNTWGPRS